MKIRGYKKVGPTWRKATSETIQVLNLQKSQWGDQFYINVGLYLKALGAETSPTEYRCHVRCRAEHLMPDTTATQLHQLLNFEIEARERYEQIQELLTRYVLPWLEVNSAYKALSKTLFGNTKGFFIHTDAWAHLGLGTPSRVRGALGF